MTVWSGSQRCNAVFTQTWRLCSYDVTHAKTRQPQGARSPAPPGPCRLGRPPPGALRAARRDPDDPVARAAVGTVGRVETLIRRATTADVPAIRRLVDTYAPERRLLSKATVVLYEDVQEFWVADSEGQVLACGALHVMWADLAEVRTLAVDPAARGRRLGSHLLVALLANARDLGVRRVFCLTFETSFFARHGFHVIEDLPIDPTVRDELLRSPDEGVAEFLDLAHVKPNTLGNTRMLVHLEARSDAEARAT